VKQTDDGETGRRKDAMSFQPIPEIVNGLPNISGHEAKVEAVTSSRRDHGLVHVNCQSMGRMK
jgi:hypothetical protein